MKSTFASAKPLSIKQCRRKWIKGPFDIDSIFMLGTCLHAFKPASVNQVLANNQKYSLTQNTKAMKRLQLEIKASKLYEDEFGPFSWYESKFMHLGNSPIYVLFLVKEGLKHGVNIFKAYVEKAVRPAFKFLSKDCKTRKEYVGERLASKMPVKLFYEDYELFAIALKVLTMVFIQTNELVQGVFFYYCQHGMKSDIDTGLKALHAVAARTEFILFTQIHFGFTLNCPPDTIILLKLKQFKSIFLNCDWNMRKMFFLLKFGHFCDVTSIDKFSSIDYAHCYETIQHRVPRDRYRNSVFCYELANGYTDDSRAFIRQANRTLDTINNILALFKGHSECLDLRIEIVENFKDVTLCKADNFSKYYSARKSPQDSLSVFPRFLDKLVSLKSFYLLRNWNSYIESQIGTDIVILKNMNKKRKKCSQPTRQHLHRIYWAENRVIAFLDGNKRRYDHDELLKYRNYVHNSDYYTIENPPSNYIIKQDIFDKHRNWNYFGENCSEYFFILYHLSSSEVAEQTIDYSFQTIALFSNFMSQSGLQSRKTLNPQTYFISRVHHGSNFLVSRSRVYNAIVEPNNVALKLIVGHCFARTLLYSEKLQFEIKNFIKEKVKYFPAKFLDSSRDWGTWAKVLDDQEMLKFGALLALGGKERSELNLKQNRNVKRILEIITSSMINSPSDDQNHQPNDLN